MNKVWVVTGTSESGDHYGPFVFRRKPTQAKLKKICKLYCDFGDGDDGDGPGDFGSYTYLTMSSCAVED